MRMRRKKNLEERLDAAGDILLRAKSDELNFRNAEKYKKYIDFNKWFGNDNPMYLEIGCGKGQFAEEFAKRNPDINLLAVEKSSNVIVDACQKAIENNLSNVKFLNSGAEYLNCFLKPDSVDLIFLNFSCPFPKNKYAKHRLTSPMFLNIYKTLLKKNGEIHQKTDNMHFFEYSIEQFSNNGYCLKNISLDLHNSDFEGNIVTEYESRFVNEGKAIYRLEATLDKSGSLED